MSGSRWMLGAAVGLLAFAASPVSAQFGGRAGDVVFYAITNNGSGDFQTVAPGTTNTAQTLSAFGITTFASVPYSSSDPFPLKRKVFYMTPQETFQVGTDFENTIGLHRLNLYDVKILQLEGAIDIAGQVGFPNSFITLPKGLDDGGDISLQDVTIVTWFKGPWPFIQVTNTQGPYPCPNGTSGFQCFLQIPNSIQLPSLKPWTNMATAYPTGGWKQGIDQKVIDQDPNLGDTIRQIRLRPGTQTPIFKVPGHTHLLVLQGAATITPAGGKAFQMNKYDYAYVPEGFAVQLANPAQYTGPTTK